MTTPTRADLAAAIAYCDAAGHLTSARALRRIERRADLAAEVITLPNSAKSGHIAAYITTRANEWRRMQQRGERPATNRIDWPSPF